MKLREEMAQRAVAAGSLGPATPQNPPMSGWIIESESWSHTTQAAVEQVMAYVNAVFDMVLRLAEAVDELRDALDVQRGEDA
jgi:hypothetical protein